MTRATLVTRIGMLTSDTSDQRFTAAQKQAEIEKAQEQFVLDTRCLKDVAATITTVDGTASYDLPTDIMDVFRVAHKGIKLDAISEYDLDVLTNVDWSTTGGTPKRYFVDLDPNNKKIRLYPIPSANDAGANLIIEYLKIPPTLAGDSSVPFDAHTLLIPYHDALAYWAAASLLGINPDAGAIASIQKYTIEYEKLVTKCIDNFRSMGEQKPYNFYRGRNPTNIGR